jgi:type IV secretion system protein VirD4
MRNYAGHRLAPWLAHVMVSRQETARALLTPGEVMQLPPSDELVMVAGHPPVRAKKLRYYADRAFTRRVLPPPVLLEAPYADRPAARADDWTATFRSVDARLLNALQDADPLEADGREQARQPSIEPAKPEVVETPSADPLGLGDEDADPATDRCAIEQARALGAARTAFGVDRALAPAQDMLPGF